MKKFTLILLTVLFVFSFVNVTAFAEASEPVQNTSTDNSVNFSKIELAITICLMFIVISVIGVMFMKTVIKNNKRRIPRK